MGLWKNTNRKLHQQYYNLTRLQHRIRTGQWPPQIVFLHIPKTGGTTIQGEFSKYLGSTTHGRICRFDSLYVDPAPAQIEKARTARYVGGHLDWHTAQHFMQPGAFTFSILRHPFDRFVSTYLYLTNFPPHFAGQEVVAHLQGMDIETFITSQDPVVRLWTNGLMTRQFGGSFRSLEVSEDMVPRAIERLRSMTYIGFQHHLDDDLRAIASACGIPVPARVKRANVTVPDARKDKALERLRGDLAPLLDKLISPDMKIYSALLK